MLGNKTNLVELMDVNSTQRYGLEMKDFYLLRKGYPAKDTNFVVLGFSPFDLKHQEQTWSRGAGGSDRTSSY